MFSKKKASQKGTADYQIYKLLMNALSGKMGQQVIMVISAIIVGANMTEEVDTLTSWRPLFNQFDSVIGHIVEMEKPDAQPSHCVYIAAFILAYSRILMSKALYRMNGYYNENNCFYYTDTDSYILPREAVPLIGKDLLGEDLGQFSDELDGGKIVAGVFLAPKTYCIVYVKPDNTAWTVIRCKGIPHTGAPIPYTNAMGIPIEESSTSDEYIDLKKWVYKVYNKTNDTCCTTKHLTYRLFLLLLNEPQNYVIEVHFGSIVRRFTTFVRDDSFMSLQLKNNIRELNKTNWWESGKRTYVPDLNVSYPDSHYLVDDTIDT
jgi:hypothetical protein